MFKKDQIAAQQQKVKKKVRVTALQTPGSEKKEEEKALQLPEQRLPFSLWKMMKIRMVEQVSTLQPTPEKVDIS